MFILPVFKVSSSETTVDLFVCRSVESGTITWFVSLIDSNDDNVDIFLSTIPAKINQSWTINKISIFIVVSNKYRVHPIQPNYAICHQQDFLAEKKF